MASQRDDSFKDYAIYKLIAGFLGLTGAATGIFILEFNPEGATRSDYLDALTPVLLFSASTVLFEVFQMLYCGPGRKARRLLWYGSYLFGLATFPVLWAIT